MHRRSILRAIPCDLKRLPIGAREAFVLSQLHGRTAVEDLAEVTALDLDDLLQLARRLVELGALEVEEPHRKTRRPGASAPRPASTKPPPVAERRGRSLLPREAVPVARTGPDLRSLSVGPREVFVLSQVDGMTSIADLAEITGLTEGEVSDVVRTLEAAGVVGLDRARMRPSKAPHGTPSRVPSAAPPRAPSRAPPKAPSRRPAARTPTVAPARPSQPDEARCDLPEAERARITEASALVATLDHYGVLAVERDADARTIRRAYHALAAQFHPDRHFGKALGPFRQPLERVFVRLTAAYDTLSHKGKRAAYDATLPPAPVKLAPTRKPPPAKTPTRRSMRAARPSTATMKRAPTVRSAPKPAAGTPVPAPVPVP
ncbi:MAG: DnaJ domain-containing protein, partial [Polyangiaceae bacterium]